MPDEIDLLRQLVAIPSVSGEEEPLARFVENTARSWGLEAIRDELAVRIEVRGRADGPTLALVSHLDVVPPGKGWTRDPFTPVVEGTGQLVKQDPAAGAIVPRGATVKLFFEPGT